MKLARRGLPELGAALLVSCLALAASQALAEVYVYEDPQGGVWFTDNPSHPGFQRYGRPKAQQAHFRSGASPALWDGVIRRMGRAYGVSPALVKAVIHAESGFDSHAVSHKGAQGLMQLMPETAQALGVHDPFDGRQNIDAGARHLSYLVGRYDGDLSLALAAYNAGGGAVERFGGIPPYRETQHYVTKVLGLYRRYDADFR